MIVELNNYKVKCRLYEIENGCCFLSPKNEICIKTNEIKYCPWINTDDISCCIDDIQYLTCVNLINGELLHIPPRLDVIPLNLKVVEIYDK